MTALNEGRGVNPGDTSGGSRTVRHAASAQRRPGREPRRHTRWRSAGSRRASTLNEGRGVNPGDTSPALPTCRGRCRPLNEGRGVNPGDTRFRSLWAREVLRSSAQRRPGREPRRHSTVHRREATSAPIAQRRPGREPRRHIAASDVGCGVAARKPLNEGRGVNPGDTSGWSWWAWASQNAQRRPGREPRRHPCGHADGGLAARRSTKAGA